MRTPVYIDFDDVLCESARTLAELAGVRYGKTVLFEEIHSFDLGRSFGLDPHEQEDMIGLFHDEEVLASIPPISSAVAGMQAWAAAGCRLEIVTGRPPSTQAVSRAWLEQYHVPFDGITFVDKYQRGHGPVEGVRQCTLADVAAGHYALVVDDSPDMILYLSQASRLPLVLFDRPWNRHIDVAGLRGGVARHADWTVLLSAYPAPGVMA